MAARDTEKDRYPTASQALKMVQQQDNFPQDACYRLEVTSLSSGHITYRVWPVGAEEPETGCITPSGFS